MAKRRERGFPQSHSSVNLPSESGMSPVTPPSSSSTFLSFPRAASPSSITGFLSKPSKWFSRTPSNPKHPPSVAQELPRVSSSSGSRRPTISGPTDPRPILPTSNSETRMDASRSVLDLPLTRTNTNLESLSRQDGLGELRNISRKGWSRSVDDLGKYSTTQAPSINTSNIKLSTSPPKDDDVSSPTKAMIEAYRQNTPHSPHALHPHYPFPTVQAVPVSSNSPQAQAHSPVDQVGSSAHARSFSHAPFQPSKLASQPSLVQGQTLPPQPALQLRTRTSSSFERERDRDKASRTGFSFPFASGGGNKPAVNTSVPSQLAPPVPSKAEPKRISQMVHFSGFINRHPAFQPTSRSGHSLVTALSKGWKPYKAVLKGSKLYFYKPPSDRTVAIRELFPQGMDTVTEEEPEAIVEEPEPVPMKVVGKEREEVRKRIRLYRGRTTHPELSLGQDGTVTRGSSDALIHEALFGTSFTLVDVTTTEERWKHFASAVVLCLPRLVGRAKFESEFIRYASYLVSGADAGEEAELQSRTQWLSEQYLRYQGGPVDESAWTAFRMEYLLAPAIPSSLSSLSSPQPTPQLSSPEVGAFSPRPSQSQNIPSFSAVVGTDSSSFARPSLSKPRSNQSFWSALEKEGLTGQVLLKADSTTVARSLGTFHRNVLARHKKPFVAADFISYETTDVEDHSPRFEGSPFTACFGSDEEPHWLTRYIVAQLLTGGPSSSSLGLADSALNVSKTHLRSEIIYKWVRIGEHCRLSGDECSWKAIEAALCSRPIARLDKVWRRVDGAISRAVQSWIKGEAECSASEPRSTLWCGDLRERISDLLQNARLEHGGRDEQWDVSLIQQVFAAVDPVMDAYSRCQEAIPDDALDDDVSRLAHFWQSISSRPPLKSLALNQYLSQSLAAEPRQKGRFEPYHWQRSVNAPAVHTLLPLLFVEPLPTVTLIDREQIHRGKKDSLEGAGTHPGLDEVQVSRMTRMRSSPNVRRQSQDVQARDSPKVLPSGETGGTPIQMYDGELLLVVPQVLPEISVRPPSSLEAGLERRPSQIRVNNPGLDRKTSLARRNSLPSISQRSSLILPEPTSESILRVVVKAGTLDRLIDILVSGLEGVPVAVADDNGEMPLREGRTRFLKLDRAEFKATWWSLFRSFVSPLVFFEFLRKRFLNSGNTNSASVPPRVRLDIFSTLHEWIDNGGAQDALGDSELFDTLKSFLLTAAVTRVPDSVSDADRPAWSELENARLRVLSVFTTQIRRPKLQIPSARDSISVPSGHNFGRQSLVFDNIDPEILVDSLDALAATALRAVTHEDFFVTIDILEVQSVDRTGWFLTHDPATNADDIEIQSIYSHLQQIEPSPLISELAQESFYKLLPPSIRSLIRAHAVIRKWAMAGLCAPRLGIRARQARMEILLQAIEICRLRMAEAPVPTEIASQKSVRSFIETALISAIVSPESRLFSCAWLNVGAARNTSTDSIARLLSKPVVRSINNRNPLTVDLGWLLERLLEVISIPNTVDADGEAFTLINFDKRRHLHDLVNSVASLVPPRSRKDRLELDRIDIDRLNNMHREVTGPPLDMRLLKDDAYHESINFTQPLSSSKRHQRPFQRIIQYQQEKCKRDKVLRERAVRERKVERQRTEKREDDLNKAMQLRHPNSQGLKHHRSRRTMSSAFFQLMRPLSSAFSSDNIYASTQKWSVAELDFEPSGKPSLVISVVGATVAVFRNNIRLYTFNLTTEDGGRYLLQAATLSSLNSWLNAISQTAKASTAKRLTYIANAPKPQLSDHIQMPTQTATRHPTAVFGVDLDFLLQREAHGEVKPGAVPRVLEQCLSEIEARGLQEVGLYRIPGASSAINTLRQRFDSGEEVTFFSQDYVDIFAVCDAVKTWFRSLPNPIFPETSYNEVLRVMTIPDFEERLMAVRGVVQGLPVNIFHLLRRICEHLERITDYEETNQMTAQALAVLFNPTLLRSPFNDFGILMQNMNLTSQLLQTLITHFHRVFDETEADMEQDDEADTNLGQTMAALERVESRSSSVPADAIHDHDPDLEPPSPRTPDPEVHLDSPLL